MANPVENILRVLKRTLKGDPYPAQYPQRYAPVAYRVVSVHDPLSGSVLSCKYRVESRVGKGATSTVYKAIQEPIGRVVALKVLKQEFSTDEVSVKRFNREARIVSALRHRNIMSIHDIGVTDSGQPFFVMEFLSGVSLESLIQKRGPIVIARALPMFCQICDGMFYAHGKGLIHRDLKPSNVMLVDEEGSEIVKLIDFGIVKQTESQSISQRLTRKGEVWGSPVYMSPEQCMGKELDARSDVYSFGLVMYETLTGVPAFKGGAAIGAILSRQLTQMPDSFNVVAPTLRIPTELEQIVFKAIQKKPEDRFASMEELRNELDGFARQRGIKVPKSAAEKARTGSPSRSLSQAGASGVPSGSNAAVTPVSSAAAAPVPGPKLPPVSPFSSPTVPPVSSAGAPPTAGPVVPPSRTVSQASPHEPERAAGSADRTGLIQSGAAPAGAAPEAPAAGQTANQTKTLVLGSLVFLAVLLVAAAVFLIANHSTAPAVPRKQESKIQAPSKAQPSTSEKSVTESPSSPSSPGSPASTEQSRENPPVVENPPHDIVSHPTRQNESSKAAGNAQPAAKKKHRSHKKGSGATAGEEPDGEALLEQIYLKRHRHDDTHQWLQIQKKVQGQ